MLLIQSLKKSETEVTLSKTGESDYKLSITYDLDKETMFFMDEETARWMVQTLEEQMGA